jgi:hypothetical protein
MPDGRQMRAGDHNGQVDDSSVGILLSQVMPEQVEWLWEGRIPRGKLTVVDGDPGTGKSAMIMDLAARVSAGRAMPDGSGGSAAAGVVILSAEDGLHDTVRPRLDAAQGNPSRVLALTTTDDGNGGRRLLSLPQDIPLIERGIDRVEADLVTIDPLVAFFGDKTDSHRDQDVRRVLADLAALAEWTGAAIVVIRHLNKSVGGNALYRGGGSIGIIAAARSGLLVAKDPEDEDRRILAAQKSNLAKAAPSFTFSLEEAVNEAVRVTWHGEAPWGAGVLLSSNYDEGRRTQAEKASVFLREMLKSGPVPTRLILERGSEAGHSKRTLERVKGDLGVKSTRQGNEWNWCLPVQARRDFRRGDNGDPGADELADHRLPGESTASEHTLDNRDGEDRQGRQQRQPAAGGAVGGFLTPDVGRERFVI